MHFEMSFKTQVGEINKSDLNKVQNKYFLDYPRV